LKYIEQEDEKTYNDYYEFTRLNNELTTAQREIIKKNSELEKLNKYKDMFLSMAAHDLRNPLNAIIALSSFLSEGTMKLSKEEQLEFSQIIHTSSTYMLDIINNLLDISVIETGKLELKFEKVDVISFVSNIININNIIASKKDIEIVFEHEDIPEVVLDASKIEQVIHNLLSNAIKFTYNNKKVFVKLSIKDGELVIIIEDEGQGIPENELNKVFKPFSKISTRGTMGEKVTGLGLSIVHKLIESHNGRITVESKVGLGTKFSIFLPLNLK
jgi:signal transduction histidine kinase